MKIVFLKEKKDECYFKLEQSTSKLYFQTFMDIYKEVKMNNKKSRELMKEFQYAIKKISIWDVDTIKSKHNEFISQCVLFDNLVKSIFKIHLAIYNVVNESEFNANIPQPGQYMHETFLNIARKLWKEPLLIYDVKVDKTIYQANLLRISKIIKKCIRETFLQMLPFKEFDENLANEASEDTDNSIEIDIDNVADEDVADEDVADEDVADEDVGDEDVGDKDVADEDVENKDVEDKDVADEDVGDKDVADEDVGDEDVADEDVGDKDVGDEDIGDKDVADEDVGDEDIADKDVADKDVCDKDVGDKDVADEDLGDGYNMGDMIPFSKDIIDVDNEDAFDYASIASVKFDADQSIESDEDIFEYVDSNLDINSIKEIVIEKDKRVKTVNLDIIENEGIKKKDDRRDVKDVNIKIVNIGEPIKSRKTLNDRVKLVKDKIKYRGYPDIDVPTNSFF
jgi:hypothetical protein